MGCNHRQAREGEFLVLRVNLSGTHEGAKNSSHLVTLPAWWARPW